MEQNIQITPICGQPVRGKNNFGPTIKNIHICHLFLNINANEQLGTNHLTVA